jgi:hypothetical protein
MAKILISKKLLKTPLLLRLCSIGTAAAGLLLVLMSFVPRVFTREEQMAIWSGSLKIDSEYLLAYTRQFYTMFTLVSLYLIGHFSMWFGYGHIVNKRLPVAGQWITIIGLLSCFTDFSEYSLRGAMIKSIEGHLQISPLLIFSWWLIREWSIWLIYLGSIIVSAAFFNHSLISRMPLLLALIGLMTIPCLYLFHWSKVWFIWLILWHFFSAFVILKASSESETLRA